uniref:F-box/FBD/LRR-repeat protein At1g13570-like n=1 Tax=Nicotiana tabacum TaxID=4097 RepID=A0A1S4CH72_TOBAC
MMTDTFKGLEDGRDKLDRLIDLPINIRHQIQEHMTIEDAARMSVLSSKWRHIWASNPKLRISADYYRKTNQTCTIDIINRILLQHYGPIKTFLLDISMINPFEHSVIDLWMLHLSRNGLVELTLRSLEYLNAPYKLTPLPPCSFAGFHKLKSLKSDGVAFELDVATSFLSVPNLLDLKFLYHKKKFHRQHEAMNLVKLLSSLPEVRGLILDGCSLKFLASGNVARRLSTMLHHLDSLKFYGFDFKDEDQICSLLCIIRSCLNLKLQLLLSRIKKDSGMVDLNQLKGQGCRIDELNNLQAL